MKKMVLAVFAVAFVSGCANIPERKTTQVASNCVRTKPVGVFDEKCDEPKLGWKGASGEGFTIQAGGVSSTVSGF